MLAHFALLLGLLASTAAVAQDHCLALVQVDGDLYSFDAAGRPVHRLTSDGVAKTTAVWSPDGQVIAYSLARPANTIALINREGRRLSEVAIEQWSVTAVERLGWAAPQLLWYEGHTGPRLGAFELWQLPPDFDLAARRTLLDAYGHACALAPNRRAVACLGEPPGGGAARETLVIVREIGREQGGPVGGTGDEIALGEGEGFEGGLVWDATAQRIAVVQRRAEDRWLVVAERSRGSTGWRVDRWPLVGIDEPIAAVRFAADDRSVVLQGERRSYELSLGGPGAGKLRVAAQAAPDLPTHVRTEQGGLVKDLAVLDWSCPR